MAKKKASSSKKSSSKKTTSSKKSSSGNPKFGSAAWFAKYPKAGKRKSTMKSKKKK